MKKIKLFAFIALFTVLTMSAKEIDSIKIVKLEGRVTQLENYKINIENVYKAEYQKSQNDLAKDIDEKYKDVRNLFAMILILGIPSSLYGIYLMFWGIKKKVNQSIAEKIETIVEQKREDIIKLIQSQKFERRLKDTKKIIVISENEESQEEIKSTIETFKFKNVVYRINKSYDNLPEYDLIIINNCDGEFKQEDVTDIINSAADDDVCFVAYTTKQLDRNPKLNFANSKFTLYHNILTTLSFSEAIKINE
ncbi:NARF domain-containing protein [Flavobacterium sp. UBA7682]|uniref:NARF domain-containing protein n=1 Tax=Flavobacterium sp. UBA7682 TaxID=1946560 RepID=UPI0025BCA449|nr:NARF domain-containing protein [Flavobacterium sp. UBA7682]